jgi:hypothetical protein
MYTQSYTSLKFRDDFAGAWPQDFQQVQSLRTQPLQRNQTNSTCVKPYLLATTWQVRPGPPFVIIDLRKIVSTSGA